MNSRNTSINLHVQPPAAPSNHDDDNTTVGGTGASISLKVITSQLIKLKCVKNKTKQTKTSIDSGIYEWNYMYSSHYPAQLDYKELKPCIPQRDTGFQHNFILFIFFSKF